MRNSEANAKRKLMACRKASDDAGGAKPGVGRSGFKKHR